MNESAGNQAIARPVNRVFEGDKFAPQWCPVRRDLLLAGAMTFAGSIDVSQSIASAAPSSYSDRLSIMRDGVAFLRGWIGSSGPYWFLVDTGATRSAIDRRVADDLALEVIGQAAISGSAGTLRVPLRKVAKLKVSGLPLVDIAATAYDLSNSLAPIGERIAGIVGFDVLAQAKLHFDFVTQRLRPEIGFDDSGAPSVKIDLAEKIPRFRALIEDQPLDLRLDTGAARSLLDRSYLNVTTRQFAALQKRARSIRITHTISARGTGGSISLGVAPISRASIAGVALPSPALIVQPEIGYFATPEAIGFAGCYSFRGRRGIVVDYARERLVIL